MMEGRQGNSHPLLGCGTMLLGALLGLVFFRRRQFAASASAPSFADHVSTPPRTFAERNAEDTGRLAEGTLSHTTAPTGHLAVRPGWQAAPPEPLPRPTYWPAVLALGVVFLLWGFVTSYIITLVGLILFVLALCGWIQELQHEQ